MSTEFKFANYSEQVGEGKNFAWFEWEIFMAETPTNLSKVNSVKYTLPKSFPDHIRLIKDRDSRFALRGTGTGEFKISITLYFSDGSAEESTEYYLNPKDEKPRTPTFIHPIDGASMVLVPAGTFLYGSRDNDSEAAGEEKPQRQLYLPSFYIDTYPVTKAQFCMFLSSKKQRVAELIDRQKKNDLSPEDKAELDDFCEPDKWINLGNARITLQKDKYMPENDFGRHPVTSVSWYGAVKYASWAGKRLLGEKEWEKAARGTDGRKFPWGNEFDKRLCNSAESNLKRTTEVNSFPKGKSPYGCFDMAGNVCEWTDSRFANEGRKIVRGGSFYSERRNCRCADCTAREETSKESGHIGFRCCTDYIRL
jgi:formylglycine-generating enzyme required for sulfatase activity